MLRRAFAVPLLASVCLGAAVAPFAGGVDYSAIPPVPAEMHLSLAAMPTTLQRAIQLAEQEVGGVASSASLGDGAFTVEVFTPDEHRRVVVAGDTGEISSNELVTLPGRELPDGAAWVETDSGLRYVDLVVGSGDTPPSPATTVEVHYAGWLVDGEKFDSSIDRGTPAQFPLNRVIPGWTEGVGSMKVGGVRKLVIPGDLAYGPEGRPGAIPPDATLVFDVELLKVVN